MELLKLFVVALCISSFCCDAAVVHEGSFRQTPHVELSFYSDKKEVYRGEDISVKVELKNRDNYDLNNISFLIIFPSYQKFENVTKISPQADYKFFKQDNLLGINSKKLARNESINLTYLCRISHWSSVKPTTQL